MISIKNVSFSFFNSTSPAIENVSLDIRDGEFLAVTGPSGCGKSTLALIVGGYIPHVLEGRLTGEVLVDGKGTADMTLAELSAMAGIVQQDPEAQLCTLNVYDEVSFGPENLGLSVEEVCRHVEESLEMAGISKLRERQLYELSGGEKQRVAIASMLAMRPRILILDEPTAGLDPSGASSVLAAISDLKKRTSMSIIVIEHKLDKVVPLADRLVVMEKGGIAFDGPPEEVLDRYHDSIKNIGVRLPQRRSFSLDGAPNAPAGETTVEARDVRFSYGSREILKGVNFRAHRSEIVGIIGPNGSGKTTFLTHLLGINRPSGGTVSVLGMDAARSKTSALARRVGYVFQNPDHQIFEKTVQEEASFACRNFGMTGREAFIEASLKRYGLSEYRQKHPHGLSFGEKRRLNLCSILPHGPEVIVLDEPFVGQDYFSVMKMMADMHALKDEGKTLVLVSHDIEMVFKHCDRVVCFKDGLIIVDAPPEEARAKLLGLGMDDYVPGGMGI